MKVFGKYMYSSRKHILMLVKLTVNLLINY